MREGGPGVPLNHMKPIIRIHIAACLVLMVCGVSFSAEEKPEVKQPDTNDYCASCHEGLAQASLKDPVDQWKSSVHAGEGKKCSLCHGGDPGVNDKMRAKSRLAHYTGTPEKKKIPEFCGREGCHADVLEQFRNGPHYLSVQKTGDPGCVFCHGSHAVRKTSLGAITEKSCAACHTEAHAKEMVAEVRTLDGSIKKIDASMKTLAEKRADVAVMMDRLDNTRRLFSRMVHVSSRSEMKNSRKSIEDEVKSLISESRSKVASIQRLDILYVTMVVFALAIIGGMIFYILIMYSRRKK